MKKDRIFLALALLGFVLLFYFWGPAIKNPTTSSASSFSKVASSFAKSIRNKFYFLFYASELSQENKMLADKITALEVDKSKIAELQYENSLLRKELGFVKENQEQEMIPARIVGREPTSFLDYVYIDKGLDDGVIEKAPVISNGALIGQVKEVYDKTSKVVLITSKDSNILVMLQESRAKGILKGGIAGLVLEDIIQDVDTEPGENIITSGLDEEIPQGLLVGMSGQLKSSPSDLFKRISVEPAVDLSKIEIIFIFK